MHVYVCVCMYVCMYIHTFVQRDSARARARERERERERERRETKRQQRERKFTWNHSARKLAPPVYLKVDEISEHLGANSQKSVFSIECVLYRGLLKSASTLEQILQSQCLVYFLYLENSLHIEDFLRSAAPPGHVFSIECVLYRMCSI
jgi:hypothetical protein